MTLRQQIQRTPSKATRRIRVAVYPRWKMLDLKVFVVLGVTIPIKYLLEFLPLILASALLVLSYQPDKPITTDFTNTGYVTVNKHVCIG